MNKKVAIGAGVLVLAGAGVYLMHAEKNNNVKEENIEDILNTVAEDELEVSVEDTSDVDIVAETPEELSVGVNEYTARKSYEIPGGTEEFVSSTFVLDDAGVVVSFENSYELQNDMSKSIVDKKFVTELTKTEIVGKNINDLEDLQVAGATLTTNAFNEAVEEIKETFNQKNV